MTVGETLTEARHQAGLSVDELSERTRIRPTVIRSIERDDYAACGGELYVRGYVRAIAGAVGIDALPLIRKFDQARPGGDAPAAAPGIPGAPGHDATRFDLPAVAGDPDATRFDLPAVPPLGPPAGDQDATRFDLPVIPGLPPAAAPFGAPAAFGATAPFDAAAPVDATAAFGEVPPAFPPAEQQRDSSDTRFDLGPVTDDDLMAAGYQLPASQGQPWPGPPWQAGAAPPPVPPAQAGGGGRGRRGRPPGGGNSGQRAVAYAVIAAAAAVALVVLAVRLASHGTAASTAAGAAASRRAGSPGGSGSASASAAARASAEAKASAAASASAAAKATKPAAVKAVPLPIAAARAFGPDGFADGDNPGLAGYTIAANPAEIWSTQWYATPDFGKLKHGTGLLLDLGRTMTITGVRFDLTQYLGTSLQIRVGDDTAPQALRIAASAQDTGGVVRLALRHPEAARYLVIWFTLLAPDGAGHYQESVSHVAIAGHR